MGSACYTPLKREFLWWYWLLLASVVGIPMFLAAWYISHRGGTEEDRLRLGLVASRVFLASAFLSVGLAAGLACWLTKHRLYVHLVGGYVICMLLANSMRRAWLQRPRWGQRVVSVLGHTGMWWVVCFFAAPALPVYSLGTFVLEPAVCALPVVCWARFVEWPTMRRAWLFLMGLLLSALLFWTVAQLWPLPSREFYVDVSMTGLLALPIPSLC